MNKACECLSISPKEVLDLTDQEIKHKYRKLALKYHPDKCDLPDATERFQVIQEAYEYICTHRCITPESTDYRSLLVQYLSHYFPEPDIIMEILLKGLNVSFCACLNRMDIKHIKKLYSFLQEHKVLFNVSDEIINKLYNMMCDNTIQIELQCSLKDLFEKKVYVLERNNETIYVPLWHEEINFSLPNEKLIVTCHCKVDKVEIDNENNIHVFETRVLTRDMLIKDSWNCTIDDIGIFTINEKIEPKYYQKFVLREKGIPLMNMIDIFDISKLSDIVIHLYLELS